MSTIANLTVALNADVSGFVGATKTVAQQTRAMNKLASDAFKATRTDAEQYDIAIRKISDAYALGKVSLEVYQRSVNQLHDEYHGVAEAAAQAQRAQAEMAAAGARVARQVRTPLEAYKAELVELRRLLRGSAIDQETFNRARRAGLQAVRNTGPRADIRAQGAAVFNSTRTAAERYAAEIQRLDRLLQANAINLVTHRRAVLQARNAYQAATTANAGGGNGIGSQLAGGLLGFSTGVGATIVAANAATRAVRGMTGAIADAGLGALKTAAEFETAEITLTTLFKSAETARDVMGQLKQFSAETPFEFPEIKDAAAKLAGFGIEARQIVPTLKMLGDISAGTGTAVGELAETYGKARITGRAYTRDVMELANRNVPIWQALNKVLGTTNAETHKLVEDGKVGFAELQKAILSLVSAGGQFEGAMADRAKGVEGLFSNLRDNVTIAMGDLGESLIKDLNIKGIENDAIALTGVFKQEMIPVLGSLARDLKTAATAFDGFMQSIGLTDFNVKGLTKSMQGLHVISLHQQMLMARMQGDMLRVKDIQKELIELGLRAAGIKQAAPKIGLPDIEAGGSLNNLDQEIAAIQREADMIGKSALEKKLAELATKGLLEADMEYVAALLEKIDTENAAAAAAERTRSTMESHIAALKQQADTYGMTARQIDLYRAAQQKATDTDIAAINAQHDRIEKQRKSHEATEQAKKDADDFDREIKGIIRQNETPLEKFNREMQRISELREHGLSDEQFRREADRLKKELDESEKRGTGQQRVGGAGGALVAGTSGFYSAIARSLSGQQLKAPQATKEERQMLQIQRRQEIYLRNIDKRRPKVFNLAN